MNLLNVLYLVSNPVLLIIIVIIIVIRSPRSRSLDGDAPLRIRVAKRPPLRYKDGSRVFSGFFPMKKNLLARPCYKKVSKMKYFKI